MGNESHDKEIELYRGLLDRPTEFRDAFGWSTVFGIFFCGLVMLPGSIYLALMTGGNLGPAASWVTVILFMEIARRALKPLSRQHLVILLHAANVMMAVNLLFPGGPMGGIVYRAYIATSEVARDAGMTGAFPSWFCPPPDSPAITGRLLLHKDWLVPIAIAAFVMVIGFVKRYTLGYFFYRITSDVENLPFPLAPIAAQGAMALSEADSRQTVKTADAPGVHAWDEGDAKPRRMSWRVFSLGAVLGLVFGLVQVGIPGLTRAFFGKAFFLLPQPFVDTTVLTQGLLPATPTGLTVDLGIILVGFVLPFWSVIGTFLAIIVTLVANPLLQQAGVLNRWQPGMDTVNTTFSNSIDFWMSFTIGAGLGIAVICIFASTRDVIAKVREYRRFRVVRPAHDTSRAAGISSSIWETPKGRGDYPLWLALVLYLAAASAVVMLCIALLPKTFGVIFFLIFFTFIYSPFISYVNARLLGLTGQSVDIPFVREGAFLMSGARGLDIWLAPVPVENYGYMAQAFRINELTGVSFRSLIKTELVALPVLFILSMVFWGYIWKSDAVPSDLFPAAQVNWELAAKNQVLLFSSTFVPPGEDSANVSIMDSEFMQAVHPQTIGVAFAGCVGLYAVLSFFGLPVMLVYGMIRGLGQLPHFMLLELVGALLGRLYFQRKYGQRQFLILAPALVAGYFTGVGLLSMVTMALMLIKSAITSAPF
jgi:hypothetical protein